MNMLHLFWKWFMQLKNPSCKIRSARMSKNLRLEKNVTLEYGSHILTSYIGKYTYINKYCLIDKNTKSIGRFCSIAYNVKIGMGNHPAEWASTHPFAYDKNYGFVKENFNFKEKVTKSCIIGNDVWIGANAIILAGVEVGDGAIIGANSLVTGDVEPYSIVYGTPAKQQRYRFEKGIITDLLNIKWWNWDEQRIKENIHVFNNPEKVIALAKNIL